MARSKKYTVDQVGLELRKTLGSVVLAAENLGCSYNTVQRYINLSPKLQRLVSHYRERRVDKAELKLEQAINRGESWAIALTLRTLGRNRGYVERSEVTGADGGPTRVIIEYTNDWRADSSSDTP